MNKTKMTLAVTGGVAGLVVLALAVMTWQASSAKVAAIEGDPETGEEGLDSLVSKAESLSRGPVYPSRESMTAIESNRQALVGWTEEARKFAARGDRIFPPMTAAAFKSFIVSDAKRLMTLPGAAEGQLAKPEFAFGPFKDYIVEGKMPAGDQLPVLQRRWDDVAMVTEVLAQCGIAEMLDVQFKDDGAVESAEPKDKVGKKKPKVQKKSAKKQEEKSLIPPPHTYVFTFATRPVGLIKAINALQVGERFAVVEGFTFGREHDAVADALNYDEKEEAKKQAARARGRGRGRGRARVEEEEKEANDDLTKNGIVTDPLLDAPLKATLTVSIYDFRTLEEGAEDGSSEKKGASK